MTITISSYCHARLTFAGLIGHLKAPNLFRFLLKDCGNDLALSHLQKVSGSEIN